MTEPPDALECPMCGGKGRVFRITDAVNAAIESGAVSLTPLAALDVDRLAAALHQMGFVYYAGMDTHEAFGECFCSDARREDARSLLQVYAALRPPAEDPTDE